MTVFIYLFSFPSTILFSILFYTLFDGIIFILFCTEVQLEEEKTQYKLPYSVQKMIKQNMWLSF